MGRFAAVPLLLGVALVASACAANSGGPRPGIAAAAAMTDADSDGGCRIELEVQTASPASDVAAFAQRLRGIAGIVRVDQISREEHIDRFIRQLRSDGYSDDRFKTLRTRAESEAGAMLVLLPQQVSDTPQILDAIEELPYFVISAGESNGCSSWAK